jgi:ATP-dependent RNA helicase DDX19/DBP5
MERDERDEYVEKFRTNQVNVVITTDLLARGFDMPTIKLVINFDVPMNRSGEPEEESYLHRIGRAGRFGTSGVGITLFDREQDEQGFWKIIEYFNMKSIVKKLDGGAEQLREILKEITEKESAM